MWRTWERQTVCKTQPVSRLAHTMLSYWPARKTSTDLSEAVRNYKPSYKPDKRVRFHLGAAALPEG